MSESGSRNNSKGLTRRRFLKTSTGVIALTVSGIPFGCTTSQANAQSWSPTPGKASQRIEGVTKVTGGKIYARDYNSGDLSEQYGWPQTQWYAMFLRALTTDRAFLDVDLSTLPPEAQPVKVVYGNNLATGQLNPVIRLTRDMIVDEQIYQAAKAQGAASGTDLDHPSSVEFDLIVRQGSRANFLGQAVALLLFDTRVAFRAAQRQIQFDDAAYQKYGPKDVPNPAQPPIFGNPTLYVKQAEPYHTEGGFSYFTSTKEIYDAAAKEHADQIDAYLANTPDLITYPFTAGMRAMDPMFMEPESGLIWYDGDTETMNVLLGTQSPDGDITDIAQMYGDTGSNLTVKEANLISCFPGGGFGGRDSSPFSLMLGICAEFAEGNAVKLEYDRFEQFRVGLKRHACDLNGLLAVTPDQKIKVIQMDMTFDGGGRKNLSPYVAQLAALCAGGSYKVPMANIAAKAIHTENVSGGSQRGFGGPQAFFATETAMDELAAQQGWDPLEMRKRNVVDSREDTTVVGGRLNQDLRLHEMLERAEAHPLWKDRHEIKAGYAQRGITYGTGLAMSLQAYGTSGDGVIASIILMPDGTYHLQSDAVDMGNGSATTLGVVIGDILGANASTVDMGGNTLFHQTGMTANRYIGCPDDPTQPDVTNPTWEGDPLTTKKATGSSSACLTGLHQVHVVQQAAEALFQNTILPIARDHWGDQSLSKDDTAWRDGALTAKDYTPLPLPQIADILYNSPHDAGVLAHAYFEDVWISADFDTASGLHNFQLDGLSYYSQNGDVRPIPRQNTQTNGMTCDTSRASRYVWSPCVNVIGLTVDRANGQVQIENALSVLNAGKVHVEPLVSGQSQGGMAMAISYTLLEDMPPGMDGPANGEWNLNRYHVARFGDVPLATEYVQGGRSQVLDILEPLSEEDKAQGRGIAEAVMCSVAPAISNALRDALGLRFTSLPITPQKILEGLNG